MEILERWKNQMLQGVVQANKNTPQGIPLAIEFGNLESIINGLNLELEDYNEDDLPIIYQIQYRLRFIDILFNLSGVPGGFAGGLRLIYSRTVSMVGKIADDNTLLQISEILESISRKVIELVGPQDPTQFYWQYYQQIKDKPNQFA